MPRRLPIVGDGDGELAGLGVALVDDVSRLADHGLAPALEHLGQQGEMAAVVDAGEALTSASGSSLSRVMKRQ